MSKLQIKELTKDVLQNNKVEYPEKAAYECFLKFNANLYMTPKDCNTSYGNFGISVIPNMYDPKIHSGLRLTKNCDGFKTYFTYLAHQIYLHDLVEFKWEAEKEGKKMKFTIECIRKDPESVEFM